MENRDIIVSMITIAQKVAVEGEVIQDLQMFSGMKAFSIKLISLVNPTG